MNDNWLRAGDICFTHTSGLLLITHDTNIDEYDLYCLRDGGWHWVDGFENSKDAKDAGNATHILITQEPPKSGDSQVSPGH